MTGTGTVVSDERAAYEKHMREWRQAMEEEIRREDGWLAFSGLYWLNEGENTAGSDAASDVVLPDGAPSHLGTLTLRNGRVRLMLTTDVPVEVDGERVREADLRDDRAMKGPTRVRAGSVTFFVVRRKDNVGVRVLDANSPVRQNFSGRRWFPVNLALRLSARYVPDPSPRVVDVITSSGVLTPIPLVGTVEFQVDNQRHTLTAFDGGEGQLWFVFKDGTSGHETYGGGRFLYASIGNGENVILDFNQAYLPACAFTPYAMCPLPPEENTLPFRVEAGERLPPG